MIPYIVLLIWLVDKFTENCASLHGKGIHYIWEIYRAMNMLYCLDLCFILSVLSLQGICLTVSFPYLINLYFVIGCRPQLLFIDHGKRAWHLPLLNVVVKLVKLFLFRGSQVQILTQRLAILAGLLWLSSVLPSRCPNLAIRLLFLTYFPISYSLITRLFDTDSLSYWQCC